MFAQCVIHRWVLFFYCLVHSIRKYFLDVLNAPALPIARIFGARQLSRVQDSYSSTAPHDISLSWIPPNNKCRHFFSWNTVSLLLTEFEQLPWFTFWHYCSVRLVLISPFERRQLMTLRMKMLISFRFSLRQDGNSSFVLLLVLENNNELQHVSQLSFVRKFS